MKLLVLFVMSAAVALAAVTTTTTKIETDNGSIEIKYQKLSRVNEYKAKSMVKVDPKQPNKSNPSAHNVHRALAYWRQGKNRDNKTLEERRPIIKYWIRGEMDELQRRDLKDITLLVTELEPYDKRYACATKELDIAIEHMKIAEDGSISDRKVFAKYTVKDSDLYKLGFRFRLIFKNIFKAVKELNYKEFFVSIASRNDCAQLFLVELEEPNNYGDAVKPA